MITGMNLLSSRCRWSYVLGALLLLFSSITLAESQIDWVKRVAKHGAPQLALGTINRLQPAEVLATRWPQWEQQRLSILHSQNDWAGFKDRVEGWPPEMDTTVRAKMLEYASKLYIDSNDGDTARRWLRILVWSDSVSTDQLERLRRLIIHSYINQGLSEDAQSAIALYQKEYLPDGQEWNLLRGKVLLHSGDVTEAATVLATVQSRQGRLYRWLARLRADIDKPDQTLKAVDRLLSKRNSEAVVQLAMVIKAEAAKASNNGVGHLRALEHVFSSQSVNKIDRSLKFNLQELWGAYRVVAEQVGNSENLFIGDDDAWLKLANERSETDPMTARAIYAMLASIANRARERSVALEKYYLLMKQIDDSLAIKLMRHLLDNDPSIALPERVRYRLVNEALASHDIKFAAQMAKNLEVPPEDQDPLEWDLTRARVAIYAGKKQRGLELLERILDINPSLESALAQRYLQVIHDLDASGDHEAALVHYNEVLHRVKDSKIKRETFYWAADATKNMENFELAASLYLRSAFYDSEGDDIWAQSARYQAADVLVEAGLLDDAQRIYQALLKVTDDPKRIAALNFELQQLWLKQKQRIEIQKEN